MLSFFTFFFGTAALGAGVSLSLDGVSTRRLLKLGLGDLAILLVAIEGYIFLAPLAGLPEVANLAAIFVVNVLLVIVFFRLALWRANA